MSARACVRASRRAAPGEVLAHEVIVIRAEPGAGTDTSSSSSIVGGRAGGYEIDPTATCKYRRSDEHRSVTARLGDAAAGPLECVSAVFTWWTDEAPSAAATARALSEVSWGMARPGIKPVDATIFGAGRLDFRYQPP